jgi:hypothetical protein
MKFSELLGEPEQERGLPTDEAEPISVFAPVPVATPPPKVAVEYPSDPPEPVVHASPPPEPVAAPRTGLAEVNVRQDAEAPPEEAGAESPVPALDAVVDDLLPSTYRRGGR